MAPEQPWIVVEPTVRHSKLPDHRLMLLLSADADGEDRTESSCIERSACRQELPEDEEVVKVHDDG